MKRLFSLLLSAALLAAVTLPAVAEETAADARLARVTQAVKAALGLDTGDYETFHGGCSEELASVWDLSWESGRRALSIQALEDGTIVSLYRWESDPTPSRYAGNGFPVFPESNVEEAKAAAEDFLGRVLRPGESARLEEPYSGDSLGSSDSSWAGLISLNGLPSPLRWFLTVENGRVSLFSRDVPETSVIGGVPSPSASVEQTEAEEELNKTLKLCLEYVLENPGGGKAVLRYVPERIHDFCVDAVTGELIDVTELEEKLSGGYDSASGGAAENGAAPAATAAAADKSGLTEAEQEGVQQMEGVLSKETLDEVLRAESAYGLRGYALTAASYESRPVGGGEESRVLCSLRYARTDNGERLTRNISVDAKTGAVEAVRSSAPGGREKSVTEEEALKKAEAFLETWCPSRNLVLYQKGSEIAPWRMDGRADWDFTFAQEVNGLPFGNNAVYISIDSVDGSVYSLSSHWDENVTFEDANGLVSMETALTAWAETYEAALAYRKVPQKLDKTDPIQAKLMERGAEYYYGLLLSYALEREEDYIGVNAKTGELVQEDRSGARESLNYSDITGSGAKADIEKLAEYGVGYASEKFRPGKTMTQWELVALLYSLQGAALDPDAADEDDRDNAYFYACRQGVLRQAERDDGAILTRSRLVKMLLDAAGYGPAARLGGDIYTCNYSDRASIPAGELGYAAIAQALGMASGTYSGTRSATRGEAASMLCRVMEREL